MKRVANLLYSVADLKNLHLAFYKASRSKTSKAEVLEFKKQLNLNLKILQNQILKQQLDIGHYNYFTIYDPKERIICAASFPERVLHHAIMNVCHDCFERKQIFDSYATRLNKGTYKAISRAQYFNKNYKYYLKLDVRKYFYSISHTVLKKQLTELFKDSQLLELLFHIIDSFSENENIGLPIGNLSSQYFANHYLSKFDHFVKENLRQKSYVRYMDDMILWSNNAKDLKKIELEIVSYFHEKLKLELKPSILNTTKHGLKFLNYKLLPTHIELAANSKKRFIEKITSYNLNLYEKKWTQEQFQRHVLPLISFTKHASSKGFRKKVFLNLSEI